MALLAALGTINTVIGFTRTLSGLAQSGDLESAMAILLGIDSEESLAAEMKDIVSEAVDEVKTHMNGQTLLESLNPSINALTGYENWLDDPDYYNISIIRRDASNGLDNVITHAEYVLENEPSGRKRRLHIRRSNSRAADAGADCRRVR